MKNLKASVAAMLLLLFTISISSCTETSLENEGTSQGVDKDKVKPNSGG